MKLQPPACRTGRRGFTLLELMLVLVVMVIIASFALPAMDRMLDGQKVEKGAGLVRAGLGRARVSAIRSGKVHAFVYRPGSAAMAVVPLDSLAGGAGLEETFTAALDANRVSDADASERLLPRSVQFVSSAVMDTSRSAAAIEESGTAAPTAMQYILFYPDGTCQDAQLEIGNSAGRRQRITLRGLTGTSRASAVEVPR